ncbi:MAG: Asp-tRNA(Asn)/Glu-tRNA(Gln) amidotransferase subunit GatC [bacterium]
MKLSKEDVQKIAFLARVELKSAEIEKYRDQLSDILAYVNKLQEVETAGASADASATGPVNAWREDKIEGCGKDEQVLIFENMPDKENNQLKTIGIFKK